MTGTETLPRCKWHHCTNQCQRVDGRMKHGPTFLFGWLFNRDSGDQGHDTVIDERGRVFTLAPKYADVAP